MGGGVSSLETHAGTTLWWEPRGGSSTLWYDNWTNLVPLYLRQSDVHTCHPMRDLGELLTEKGWDILSLQGSIPEYVVDHIRFNMGFVKLGELGDNPSWTMSSTWKFNDKSAWDLL